MCQHLECGAIFCSCSVCCVCVIASSVCCVCATASSLCCNSFFSLLCVCNSFFQSGDVQSAVHMQQLLQSATTGFQSAVYMPTASSVCCNRVFSLLSVHNSFFSLLRMCNRCCSLPGWWPPFGFWSPGLPPVSSCPPRSSCPTMSQQARTRTSMRESLATTPGASSSSLSCGMQLLLTWLPHIHSQDYLMYIMKKSLFSVLRALYPVWLVGTMGSPEHDTHTGSSGDNTRGLKSLGI